MTELRERMIRAMQMRGFAAKTQEAYLSGVRGLAKYHHRAPDQLAIPDLDRYFEHLVIERKLMPSSVRLQLNALHFFYIEVLQWPSMELHVTFPKQPQKIPELLTKREVAALIDACCNPRDRMMLSVCYGCGLRLNELLSLKVRDIDSERGALHIRGGKGAKDRQVPLGQTLIDQLRDYWRRYKPKDWLFPGRDPGTHLSETGIQKRFSALKKQLGITKVGGIHGLRHAYATHQLEAGMALHRLQRALGHSDIHVTMRYIHWLPSLQDGEGEHDLVGQLEKGDD